MHLTTLIVCAGRGRSGSVLLYNLVRLTLSKAYGHENVYGSMHREYKRDNTAEYHVVKLHGHNNYLWKRADAVFSCHRDEEDQKKSWISHQLRMKGIKRSVKEADDFIKMDLHRFERWKAHINFVKTFEFSDMIDARWQVIVELCDLFGLDISRNMKDIMHEVDDFKLPKKGYDVETGLTRSHFNIKDK
jgi:hypothetical protein